MLRCNSSVKGKGGGCSTTKPVEQPQRNGQQQQQQNYSDIMSTAAEGPGAAKLERARLVLWSSEGDGAGGEGVEGSR